MRILVLHSVRWMTDGGPGRKNLEVVDLYSVGTTVLNVSLFYSVRILVRPRNISAGYFAYLYEVRQGLFFLIRHVLIKFLCLVLLHLPTRSRTKLI